LTAATNLSTPESAQQQNLRSFYPKPFSVIPSESRGISNYFLGETESRDVSTSLDMTKEMSAITRLFWGAHAPSRADFGASPKSSSPNKKKSLAEAPTTAREAGALPGDQRARRARST
jgi:hypothetical protein